MKGFSRIDGDLVGIARKQRDSVVVLDSIVLTHVGRLTRRKPDEILELVRNDYGEIGVRRFWRSLARLSAAGVIRRHGRKCAPNATYTRTRTTARKATP